MTSDSPAVEIIVVKAPRFSTLPIPQQVRCQRLQLPWEATPTPQALRAISHDGLNYAQQQWSSLRKMIREDLKFVEPADTEFIAEGIDEVDFGVLQMKTALQKLADQISEIGRYKSSQNVALVSTWSKKQLGELLAKGLNAQKTLQTILNKIESAATEVEMRAYDTSASTPRALLQILLLQQESIEATMARMADVPADHKEIEDASSLATTSPPALPVCLTSTASSGTGWGC
ncbi:hypothetical protein FRC00_002307 [Tulasnella sp. 408]|nr:hypothetical protein FRC00_002307 [Tulasnella sp. 408]